MYKISGIYWITHIKMYISYTLQLLLLAYIINILEYGNRRGWCTLI